MFDSEPMFIRQSLTYININYSVNVLVYKGVCLVGKLVVFTYGLMSDGKYLVNNNSKWFMYWAVPCN